MTFRHSGKLGDIVYSLPGVKAHSPALLYINADGAHTSPPAAQSMLPLLRAQPYIEYAGIYAGEPFDHDFDVFRRLIVAYYNLADCQLMTLSLPPTHLKEKWLFLDAAGPEEGNGVVFARSGAWAGAPGIFEQLYQAYGKGARFVGTAMEWSVFQHDIGPISWAPTGDLLELARIIAGCRLFIGNQSCPLAIAEGLKVPIMQAVYNPTPNCVFYRSDFFALWSPTQVPGVIREFEASNTQI
jgi:hypothetical protein